MSKYEWPANDYAIGAYIQETISDEYLGHLLIKPNAHVLDIGCGDGSYTTKILERASKGSVIGIDRSKNMLNLAQEKISDYPNFSVQQSDVLNINFKEQFDNVFSFWCLHWCPDLMEAYTRIFRALKNGGKLMTILPTGIIDPYISSFKFVKSTGEFPSLHHFKSLVDFEKVSELPDIVARIPFKSVKVETIKHSIPLPSLDIFRKFVNGLAFLQGQVPEPEIKTINEAIVKAFDLECREKYQGEYWFNILIYVVTAEK